MPPTEPPPASQRPPPPPAAAAMAPSFPGFPALPPELRTHIWQYFAPVDPHRAPQVLCFEVGGARGRKGRMAVRPCPRLAQQTASVRAMLGVHQESRAAAKDAFPHVLGRYEGRKLVLRFDRRRDVGGDGNDARRNDNNNNDNSGPGISPVFMEQVQQLAVGPRFFDMYRLNLRHPQMLLRFLRLYTALAVVYYALDASVVEDAGCAWCTSADAAAHHFYLAETDEDARAPRSRRQEVLYCWPDLAAGGGRRERAEREPSLRAVDFAASPRLRDLLEMLSGGPPPGYPVQTIRADSAYLHLSDDEVRRLEAVEYWPMVAFAGFYSIRRYRALGGVEVEKHPDDSDSD
ncbi:hypothetical protein PG999_014340 [Apiospora kogelbergensis]|uniref:2EXR domain-containing protein n=1 Tax=Apiospora kogelbergensis TaxID=1337665 RepID=A0AAW0QE24_9PEZI